MGKSSLLFVLAATILSCLGIAKAVPEAAQPKAREKEPASGTVRDERGDPVAGADVFVIKNHLGIRHWQEVLATKTDTKGQWRIEDGFGYGDVIVHKRRPTARIRVADAFLRDRPPGSGRRAGGGFAGAG